MDWWSLLFVMASGGGFVYLGMILMWSCELVFGCSHPKRVFIENHMAGLILAFGMMVGLIIILGTAHTLGWITMWEVGYAFSR